MKLHIDEIHQGGVILDGETDKGVHVVYSLVDGETGASLSDETFSSYADAEAHAVTHFSGCERWTPPPPSKEEIVEVTRILNWLEPTPSQEIGAARGIWARLTFLLHQTSLDSALQARIRSILDRYFKGRE